MFLCCCHLPPPREGVVVLPSGLQYKVLREGDGDAHPLASTSCECHYEGRTAQEWSKSPQGKKFDSSYDRGSPTSFAPNGVIKGWTEAMQLMVEGDKWEMYIPSELGYGDSGQGADIGPGDVLVFTMEIIKINGETKPANRGPPPYEELKAIADYERWSTSGTTVAVLGMFRNPTVRNPASEPALEPESEPVVSLAALGTRMLRTQRKVLTWLSMSRHDAIRLALCSMRFAAVQGHCQSKITCQQWQCTANRGSTQSSKSTPNLNLKTS